MNLDAGNIIAMIVFGTFGLAYFVYGKKRADPLFMLVGIALMAYGYATDTVEWTVGIGLLLSVSPFVLRRLGV